MVNNIESKKRDRESHKKNKMTKFTAVLLLIGIICLLISGCMGYSLKSEDKNLSYFFIGFGIFTCIIYVKLALNCIKGKRKFTIDLPIEGELPHEYYATFGWICTILLNIVVSIPIFLGITYLALISLQNLNKALWSVVFVVMPYAIMVACIMIFKSEKLNKKIWGITCGSFLGATLNSIFILPTTSDINTVYSKLVLFLAITVILLIISFILKKLNIVKNTVILMVAIYYLWAGIIFWNESFDNSKATTYEVTVVNKEKYSNSKSGTHYIIEIDDGDQKLAIDKVYVTEYEYNRYEVGDCLQLRCQQGVFGLPYVENYKEVGEAPVWNSN